jgi:hypothetical protein
MHNQSRELPKVIDVGEWADVTPSHIGRTFTTLKAVMRFARANGFTQIARIQGLSRTFYAPLLVPR